MGRVVCELLSTQFCGPMDKNQIWPDQWNHYVIPLLISAKLDERWSGFGGIQNRFDSILPPRLLSICSNDTMIIALSGYV